ncbi:hypothetical protein H5410_028857 [Solanum commersonii]|uniref:Uncharacterized protein n=1 Tax=Solanum commersonii TaxID=4109 RepID=A0A9J5Z569_SOLCO|nr:hypothetical protein H5410_028857 [Solanum commersonii]
MEVKLGRGAVLVLLTGLRNGFADFGVGREAVVAADLQSLAAVHGVFKWIVYKLFLKRNPTLKMKMNKIEQK